MDARSPSPHTFLGTLSLLTLWSFLKQAEFPPSMLKLALPEKTFEKYMQYRQDDELKQVPL